MKLIKRILLGLFALVVIGLAAVAVTISYTASCEPVAGAAQPSNPMQAMIYRCYGGPEVIELTTTQIPQPEENQVLVRVKAAAVNPLDWHYLRGSPYLMRFMSGIGKPSDQRLGVDFAGVVEQVGSKVSDFKPGDEVFGGGSGAYADYVVANAERSVAIKPANVSFEQAAAVPIAALTALQALQDKGKLVAGQKVLINGASGGVGTYAVQIAKAIGAEVHGVCSTRNVAMVKSIGADHVYDYKAENYTEANIKYDLIVDMVGNHDISDNLRVLKEQGRMVIVGGGSGDWIAPLLPIMKSAVMQNFVDQEILGLLAEFNRADLQTLAELLGSGQMRTVIDRSYSLQEVPEAIKYSESGRARGKILINFD